MVSPVDVDRVEVAVQELINLEEEISYQMRTLKLSADMLTIVPEPKTSVVVVKDDALVESAGEIMDFAIPTELGRQFRARVSSSDIGSSSSNDSLPAQSIPRTSSNSQEQISSDVGHKKVKGLAGAKDWDAWIKKMSAIPTKNYGKPKGVSKFA
jgi:hypothetical protein